MSLIQHIQSIQPALFCLEVDVVNVINYWDLLSFLFPFSSRFAEFHSRSLASIAKRLTMYWIVLFFISTFAVYCSSYKPYWFNFIKPLPIFILLNPLTTQYDGLSLSQNIGLGLFFGSIGDICLLREKERSWFTAGLAFFLIGHIFYILGLASDVPYVLPLSLTICTTLWYILYGLFLIRKLQAKNNNDLVIPVICYLTVITGMFLAAINRDVATKPDIPFFSIGSVLFLISDTLIGFDKFVTPIPNAKFWVLTTYYAAQTFITRPIISSHFVNYQIL